MHPGAVATGHETTFVKTGHPMKSLSVVPSADSQAQGRQQRGWTMTFRISHPLRSEMGPSWTLGWTDTATTQLNVE